MGAMTRWHIQIERWVLNPCLNIYQDCKFVYSESHHRYLAFRFLVYVTHLVYSFEVTIYCVLRI